MFSLHHGALDDKTYPTPKRYRESRHVKSDYEPIISPCQNLTCNDTDPCGLFAAFPSGTDHCISCSSGGPIALQALLTSPVLTTVLSGQRLDERVRQAAIQASSSFEFSPADATMRATITAKVLDAFLQEGVAESDLAGSTGYGYNDPAREHYEALLARLYRAERALARLAIVSGTHAIMLSLAALAPAGQRLISCTGRPYDTLHHAIVTAPGSLVTQGILFEEVALTTEGQVNLAAIERTLQKNPGNVSSCFIQRSRGYAPRPSLSVDDVAAIAAVVRRTAPQALVLVDNCYGELVEEREPIEVGADLVMGSLIKNLGGGIAPAGGYVAGRADLIERIATRLYAPGLSDALGPTLGFGRLFFQGLFQAPQMVWEALRGQRFAAALFAELGYGVDPLPTAPRRDIVQAIRLGALEPLQSFAQTLQQVLPINARFRPVPGPVPGYRDQVIMSGGSFVAGATIELSCDAPLRAPYEMYLQGGLHAEHVAIGALACAHALLSASR